MRVDRRDIAKISLRLFVDYPKLLYKLLFACQVKPGNICACEPHKVLELTMSEVVVGDVATVGVPLLHILAQLPEASVRICILFERLQLLESVAEEQFLVGGQPRQVHGQRHCDIAKLSFVYEVNIGRLRLSSAELSEVLPVLEGFWNRAEVVTRGWLKGAHWSPRVVVERVSFDTAA